MYAKELIEEMQEIRKHWFTTNIGNRIFAIKPCEKVAYDWYDLYNYGIIIMSEGHAKELYDFESEFNLEYTSNKGGFRFYLTREESDDAYGTVEKTDYLKNERLILIKG